MKKFLLLFLIIGSFKINAQISVFREDLGFPNEWYLMAKDTNVDVEEQAAILQNGPNCNWDATGIRAQSQDTFFYLSPQDFPSAPEGCNLVYINPIVSSLPDFYNANIAQLKQIVQPVGFFGGEGRVLYLEFPSTFGSKFADSITTTYTTLAVDLGIPANPLFDSAQIYFKTIYRSDFIGYGTLRTKFNNFPINAIKRKLIKSQRTSFKVRNKISGAYVSIPGGFDPGGVNTDKTIYQWFGTNSGVSFLEFEMDTINKVKNLKYLVNSSRLMSTGLTENEFSKSINIYPNPGKEYFQISFQNHAKIEHLSIYNTSGILLKEFFDIYPDQKVFHEIETNGLYIIQIKQENKIYHYKWLKN
jgi:hypothetical protein